MAQVSNERAVVKLAKALKRYDDSNPDVGFPPFWSHFVDMALAQLELQRSDVDYRKIVFKEPKE